MSSGYTDAPNQLAHTIFDWTSQKVDSVSVINVGKLWLSQRKFLPTLVRSLWLYHTVLTVLKGERLMNWKRLLRSFKRKRRTSRNRKVRNQRNNLDWLGKASSDWLREIVYQKEGY